MKKILTIGLVVFVIVGCSGKEEPVPEKNGFEKITKIKYTENAPFWVKNPASLDNLSALGKAPKTTGGIKFQKIEAVASARDDLRKVIKQKTVKTVNTAFLEILKKADNGDFKKEEILEISKKIATHVSLSSISGSSKKAIWFDKKENLYILVSIDENIIKKMILDGTRIVLRSNENLYKVYKKYNGRVFLKKTIDKEIFN